MNTWIWNFVRDDGTLVTYQHGARTITFPRNLFVAFPKYITDQQVADLRCAAKLLTEQTLDKTSLGERLAFRSGMVDRGEKK